MKLLVDLPFLGISKIFLDLAAPAPIFFCYYVFLFVILLLCYIARGAKLCFVTVSEKCQSLNVLEFKIS